MLAVSCLMPVFCLLVTRVSSPTLAIALLTALMFGHAAWGTSSSRRGISQACGGHGFGIWRGPGGLTGVITQATIGWVVQNYSFAPIFAAISFTYLLAFALVHILVGELGSIRKLA